MVLLDTFIATSYAKLSRDMHLIVHYNNYNVDTSQRL